MGFWVIAPNPFLIVPTRFDLLRLVGKPWYSYHQGRVRTMKVGGCDIRIIRGREQQTIQFIMTLHEILQTLLQVLNKIFIFTLSCMRG